MNHFSFKCFLTGWHQKNVPPHHRKSQCQGDPFFVATLYVALLACISRTVFILILVPSGDCYRTLAMKIYTGDSNWVNNVAIVTKDWNMAFMTLSSDSKMNYVLIIKNMLALWPVNTKKNLVILKGVKKKAPLLPINIPLLDRFLMQFLTLHKSTVSCLVWCEYKLSKL